MVFKGKSKKNWILIGNDSIVKHYIIFNWINSFYFFTQVFNISGIYTFRPLSVHLLEATHGWQNLSTVEGVKMNKWSMEVVAEYHYHGIGKLIDRLTTCIEMNGNIWGNGSLIYWCNYIKYFFRINFSKLRTV